MNHKSLFAILSGIIAFGFLTSGIASDVQLSVTTDTSNYQSGDIIYISISGYNPTPDTLVLNFGSGLQAGFFIGDQESEYFGIGIMTQAVIPPGENRLIAYYDHRLEDYPLQPGAYPIVAYLEEQHFTLSPPHIISIDDVPADYPMLGFYPRADSLSMPAHCIFVTYSVDTSLTETSTQMIRFDLDNYYVLVLSDTDYVQSYREVQEFIMYVADPDTTYDLELFWADDSGQYAIECANDQWIGAQGGWITLNLAISQNGIPIDTLSQPIFYDVQAGLESNNPRPSAFNLKTYPNPTNAAVTIQATLQEKADLVLDIFDLRGQKVFTHNEANAEPGKYQLTWNGLSSDGLSLDTGVYMIRLKTRQGIETRKILMLK